MQHPPPSPQGLRLFPAMVIVPTMQIAWTLFAIVSGMLYFEEYLDFSGLSAAMFFTGVMVRGLAGAGPGGPAAHACRSHREHLACSGFAGRWGPAGPACMRARACACCADFPPTPAVLPPKQIVFLGVALLTKSQASRLAQQQEEEMAKEEQAAKAELHAEDEHPGDERIAARRPQQGEEGVELSPAALARHQQQQGGLRGGSVGNSRQSFAELSFAGSPRDSLAVQQLEEAEAAESPRELRE